MTGRKRRDRRLGFDDDIAILAAAPVFGFLDEAALRLLTFAGERHTLSPGEILFRRDDRADAGYVVMSGEIALAARTPGGAPILAGPSALIGRNALFALGRRPSEAIAVTLSDVMRISAQLMGRVLREFPDAASAIHRWLADDLLDLTYDLGGVRERLTGHGEQRPRRGS